MVDHGAMKPFSEDLRQKVVEAVEQRGTSKSEAARLFSISLSSVKRYIRVASRGEPLAPRKGGGRPPKKAPRGGHTHKTRRHRRRETSLPEELRWQEP